MALTQINLDNTSEEMVFHIKKKYKLKKSESINLLINVVSDIFDENKDLIYKQINQLK